MYERYLIKKSDNLEKIAQQFNTTVDYLKSVNNLYYTDNLKEGLEIIVPSRIDTYYTFFQITKGDTLYNISQEYNINPELLAALNGLNIDDYIYDDTEILIPKANYSYYITKEGDTIDTVANIFSVGKSDLLKENTTIYLMDGQLLAHSKK